MEKNDLKAYFRKLWPPRKKELAHELVEAFNHENWSRVNDDDWKMSRTGKFEALFAEKNKSRYALAVSNGTVGLELALRSLDVGINDEVIVPALSFVATSTAVLVCGAVPVFVDVNKSDMNINIECIKKAITPKTKAIIIVHLAGVPCDMDRLVELSKDTGIPLVEDCSHAHGSEYNGIPVGNFGTYGVFSLQEGKLLTCGEGAVLTSNDDYAFRRLFSHHQFTTAMKNGKIESYLPVVPSNSRLCNLLGSLLLPQMLSFESEFEKRLKNIEYFSEQLLKIQGMKRLKTEKGVTKRIGFYYSFYYDKAFFNNLSNNDFMDMLDEEGIPSYKGHNYPMYWREPFKTGNYQYRVENCQIAENYSPNAFINFRHDLFLAEKEILDVIVAKIKSLQGAFYA